jgi:hypothetical protein
VVRLVVERELPERVVPAARDERPALAPPDAAAPPLERRVRAPALAPPDAAALPEARRPVPLGVTAARSLSKSLSRVLLVRCASRRSVRIVFVTSL